MDLQTQQKQFPAGNYTSGNKTYKRFISIPKETNYASDPVSLQESLKLG